nr:glycine/sarcosine/betaine reductase selenoprotein B family protein [Caldalkalibacillus salinus]
MKARYVIQSKVIRWFSTYFPQAYKKYSLKAALEKSERPESALAKSIKEAKVALLTSSGVHLRSDQPFEMESDGDYTYRTIPSGTSDEALTATHLYYDTDTAKKDISIVFPLQALKAIHQAGEVGEVSDSHIGVYGGTIKPEPHEQTAKEVAQILKEREVDVLLLTPG